MVDAGFKDANDWRRGVLAEERDEGVGGVTGDEEPGVLRQEGEEEREAGVGGGVGGGVVVDAGRGGVRAGEVGYGDAVGEERLDDGI